MSAAASNALEVAECIQRGELCKTAAAEHAILIDLVFSGLTYFAVNERHRRTFFALQKENCSRPPSYNPTPHDWDYLYTAVSPEAWSRRNPYGPSKAPPGQDYSYTEDPAEERRAEMVADRTKVDAQVAALVEPPGVVVGRLASNVFAAELRARRSIEAEWKRTLEESESPFSAAI